MAYSFELWIDSGCQFVMYFHNVSDKSNFYELYALLNVPEIIFDCHSFISVIVGGLLLVNPKSPILSSWTVSIMSI
jgi:hypothetical protein